MDVLTAPHTTTTAAHGARAGVSPWPAIAAWGAGLIQLALGAGTITGVAEGPAIRVAGILLIVLGATTIGWGAATLARGRLLVPRLSIAGSLAGVLAAVSALMLDPVRVSVFAVAAASALLLAVALGAAWERRRASRTNGGATTDAAPSRILPLVVGAFLVAALVTPALAATEAGRHAVPHGQHLTEPDHH